MYLIKIGGGAAINITGIMNDLVSIKEPVIIIHGANALRDSLAKQLGISRKTLTSLSGYQSVYSDEDAIDLIMMSYAGLKNLRIVELGQQRGINTIGLSGIDGGLLRSKRNKGIKTKVDGKKKLIRDYSGKPQSINRTLFTFLLDNGYTPVISIPTLDEQGYAINSENDDIAALIANELPITKVIQFIEAPGYLHNPQDETTVISRLSKQELLIKEEQETGRMKRKLHALNKIPCEIIIADGRVDLPLQDALAGIGTTIS